MDESKDAVEDFLNRDFKLGGLATAGFWLNGSLVIPARMEAANRIFKSYGQGAE